MVMECLGEVLTRKCEEENEKKKEFGFNFMTLNSFFPLEVSEFDLRVIHSRGAAWERSASTKDSSSLLGVRVDVPFIPAFL